MHKNVYVVLKTDKDNVATIDRIQTFSKLNEPLYLKDEISKCNTIRPLTRNGACISYGIESYYVKEHSGRELEKNLRSGTLVKVSIDKQGNVKVVGFVPKTMENKT